MKGRAVCLLSPLLEVIQKTETKDINQPHWKYQRTHR